MIVAWWHSPHDTRQEATNAIVPETPRYKTKIGYAQHQRAVRENNSPFGSIFSRRRNTSQRRRGGRR